jgi:hypothetical protein
LEEQLEEEKDLRPHLSTDKEEGEFPFFSAVVVMLDGPSARVEYCGSLHSCYVPAVVVVQIETSTTTARSALNSENVFKAQVSLVSEG